jgi:tRNA(fMet)-specific endonuclease VapC
LPFSDAAADVYGRIRADLETRGTPIGGNDLLIASIALVYGLTLVTHNTREFGRVTGLLLEDWEATS